MPCLIVEHTFHTNNTMAKWLLVDANLTKVAQCVADTVAAYYGYAAKKTTTAADTAQTATVTGTIYRIRKTWDDANSQQGAYVNLAGAKRVCPDGYSVFDGNGNEVYTPVAATVYTTSAGAGSTTAYSTTKTWKNGSTVEPVYADTEKGTKVGSLNKYESCECLGIVNGMYIVKYKVDDSSAYKVGLVAYSGGL